ncbi:MAG: 3-deoxy-8-phosphooctulonate synthase [Verrucomicrobiae bacterium]|nr:3-deoxy-8-phosphooctulonate synthase [Verrucomicrobiae bacterium]
MFEKLFNSFFLIAGPCVIESRTLTLQMARKLAKWTRERRIPFIFKASFDKANRSSIHSFRGLGMEKGLSILKEVKDSVGVPVLTDVHTPTEVERVAEAVDVLQIPAFLCRQTDLLMAAATTGRWVNVKKGQFMAPEDMVQVTGKLKHGGAGRRILLTERGTTFGYHNLVVDFRGILVMRRMGYPVVFDATHSVQCPGGAGDHSSGQPEFVPLLAKAAVAAGSDGLFIETHPCPGKALSDGSNMVPMGKLPHLLDEVLRIRRAVVG